LKNKKIFEELFKSNVRQKREPIMLKLKILQLKLLSRQL
jgi:hypothetical protein